MKQEHKNAFGKTFLTVAVDKENRWVHNNWIGYLTEENVKAGAQAYIETVRETGFSCVLNDNRQVVGSWDHSIDWAVNEWGPQAAGAGVRHIAILTNPSSFAEASANAFNNNLKAFEVQVFDNKTDAEAWLRQFSLNKK